MQEIKTLDDQEPVENRLEQEPGALPRPCCYFDFIIGTSTGG